MQTALHPAATPTLPVAHFRRLLVATDFSSASQVAFRTALHLCHTLHASLTILHVFEYSQIVTPETGGQLLELDRIYEQAHHSLNTLALTARQIGIPCNTVLGTGPAPQTILDTISASCIDLAVLGTNALHGFERLVFGSTAEAVLRAAPCPVLTVGPQAAENHAPNQSTSPSPTPQPVLFATDFHHSTAPAVRYAAALSELTQAPLHCLHVLPRTVKTNSQNHVVPAIVAEALQQLVRENSNPAQPPTCAVTYGSEVSHAIVDYACQQHASLIVLGVRRASMAASHTPSHIAYRIIAEAPCPVLTLAVASHGATAACL
jgi:nucleotide-binding universal stress UspA family protein